MKGLGVAVLAGLAAWSFFAPPSGSWAFAALEFLFIALLVGELRRVNGAALVARAQPPLDVDEADIVQRYPLYFARPDFARECASTLAGLGLASLVLVPWLTYKLQWAQAVLIGVMLFAVARLTRLLSPVYALRLQTAKGDRDALRLLSAHDGAARKLSGHETVEQPGADGERRR